MLFQCMKIVEDINVISMYENSSYIAIQIAELLKCILCNSGDLGFDNIKTEKTVHIL